MRRLALWSLLAVAVVLPAQPASAQVPQLPPGVKAPEVVRYRADLNVAGRIVITRQVDTLRECAPGHAYTMTNTGRVLYEPRRVKVRVIDNQVFIVGPRVGFATAEATMTGYRESNFCTGDPAQIDKPTCGGEFEGKVAGGISSRRPGRNPDTWLALTRVAGGNETDPACRAPGLTPVDRDTTINAFDGPAQGLAFMLDLHGRSFATLGRGKRLKRLMRFSGPCDGVRVSHGKRPGFEADDDECTAIGTIEVELKRR